MTNNPSNTSKKPISYSLKLFSTIFKISPFAMILIFVLNSVAGIVPYFEVQNISNIGTAIVENDLNRLLIFIIVLILLKLLTKIVAYLDSLINISLTKSISSKLEEDLILKTLKVPLRQKEKSEYNDISSLAFRSMDIGQIIDIVKVLPKTIATAVTIVSLFILLANINIFVPVAILAAMGVTLRPRIKQVQEFINSMRGQTTEERRLQTLFGHLMNVDSLSELKIYKAHKWMFGKWEAQFKDWAKSHAKISNRKSLKTNLLNTLGFGLIFPIAAMILLLTELKSVTDIIRCLVSIEQFSLCYNNIIGDAISFLEGEENYKNYYKLMDYPENTSNLQEGGKAEAVGVSCSNVSFSYDEQSKALEQVSLIINPGEKIAIVGQNGAGKTTLSKLIMNVYSSHEGIIRYFTNNGNNKENILPRRSVLYQNYCTYPNFTILENIMMGDIDGGDEAEAKALLGRMSLYDDETEAEGNRLIGNVYGGTELSGGQNQKLALARCFYKKNCGLYLLDEPLLSLDPIFETRFIKQFLFELEKDKTCIFVTHRLSSVLLADRILVLDNGKVAAFGSHKELMKNSEVYNEIFKNQAEMYR